MIKDLINIYKAYLQAYFLANRNALNKSLCFQVVGTTLSFIGCAYILFQIDRWAVGSENPLIMILKASVMLTILFMPFLGGILISLSLKVWLDTKRNLSKGLVSGD
jgi:hypothetical protein